MQRYVKLWVFLEITIIFVRIVANIMSICNLFYFYLQRTGGMRRFFCMPPVKLCRVAYCDELGYHLTMTLKAVPPILTIYMPAFMSIVLLP